MRILITGGAGCLGAALVEHLLPAGHELLIIDNFATGKRGNLPDHKGVAIIEGSIVNQELVDRAFDTFAPTHVIHSAASYKDPNDWLEDARTNVIGTIHVANAARRIGRQAGVEFSNGTVLRPNRSGADSRRPSAAAIHQLRHLQGRWRAGAARCWIVLCVIADRQRHRAAAGDRPDPDLLQAAQSRTEMLLLGDGA